jgi:TatD DNase family protein
MLIDTHCHLNFNTFKEDWQEIAGQSLEKNTWIINVGSQNTTSERAVEIANHFKEGVYAAVGLHPSHLFEMEIDEDEARFASRAEKFDYDYYKKLGQEKKVVAIGETGIDYHYVPKGEELGTVRERQHQVFKKHLDLADELNLPVIIHARETYPEIIGIIKEYIDQKKLVRRGVIHCYLGDWPTAQEFLNLGFLISFTGIITFPPKKSQINLHQAIMDTIKEIPLDKIMVETDAPFLAPQAFRGERNLPWYVAEVAKKIGEIKKISLNEVADQTTGTARQFFKT